MNNEEKKEYMKKYYNENKERIFLYQRKNLYCMCCDKYITKWNISKHKKRKIHKTKEIDLLKQFNEEANIALGYDSSEENKL
jgi:hypothetical protein